MAEKALKLTIEDGHLVVNLVKRYAVGIEVPMVTEGKISLKELRMAMWEQTTVRQGDTLP